MRIRPLEIEEFISNYLRTNPTKTENKSCAFSSIDGKLPPIDAVKLNFYLVILCRQGNCDVAVDYHNYRIDRDMISIIPPQSTFSIRQICTSFDAKCLLFTPEFVQSGFVKSEIMEELLLINPDYPPVFELTPAKQEDFDYKISKVCEELATQAPFCMEVSRLYILQLFFDYNRVCELCLLNSDKVINRQFQVMYAFRKLVDQHFHEHKTVKEYADKLFLTSKYVSECVKNQTGLSALTIIQQRIIIEAELLLKYSTLPVKSIADRLGFQSSSAFSRFFKSLKGISPIFYQQEQEN